MVNLSYSTATYARSAFAWGSMTRHAFNSHAERAIGSEVLERRNTGKRKIRKTAVAV
jgi:hypothetical protein